MLLKLSSLGIVLLNVSTLFVVSHVKSAKVSLNRS